MSRELHEFLNADTRQLRGAPQLNTALAEEFQRKQFTGAIRSRLAFQTGESQNLLRYLNADYCHASAMRQLPDAAKIL